MGKRVRKNPRDREKSGSVKKEDGNNGADDLSQ